LWDLVSRNLIDYFEDRQEAISAVQAYVDADEASTTMLLEYDDDRGPDARTLIGDDLVRWLEQARSDERRTA
jgi:hypothetical protein